MKHLVWLVVFWFSAGLPAATAQDNQKKNLYGITIPSAGRFAITDRVWPANPGQASICLWEDDKLAAASLTIDDNTAPDIPLWFTLLDEYGYKASWMIITGAVTAPGSNSYFGTWALFNQVKSRGHGTESHTVSHFNTTRQPTPWPGIDWEYSQSIQAIAANITGESGDKPHFLAYPGGTGSQQNSEAAAALYYAAARGTAGTINPANKINYTMTNSTSGFNPGPANSFSAFTSLFNSADRNYFRGWLCIHFHQMGSEANARIMLDAFKSKNADLWMGKYGDVTRYGQERDTATLGASTLTGSTVAFTVTDQMYDPWYDYPLTVKVRLPAGWLNVTAAQNGAAAAVKIIDNVGAKFALVKVVPDRGQVVLTRAGQTYTQWLESNSLPADGTGDGAIDAAPAGDNIPNGLKYALGLGAAQAGFAGRFTVGTALSSGGKRLFTINYQTPDPAPPGVVYRHQVSSDLAHWSDQPFALSSSATGSLVSVSGIEDAASVDPVLPRRFFRLQVTLP